MTDVEVEKEEAAGLDARQIWTLWGLLCRAASEQEGKGVSRELSAGCLLRTRAAHS